jgi:hypothetical protein
VTKALQLLACASVLLLADVAGASPFAWGVAAQRNGSLPLIAAMQRSVDPDAQWSWHLDETSAGGPVVAIALLGPGGRDHSVVRPTAVFVPNSGATTFLEQLVHPFFDGATLTPAEAGRLQPVPAFETRARPLPAPPALGRTTIRYRGEIATMLPLGLGFLGLVVVGRRPRPARPKA